MSSGSHRLRLTVPERIRRGSRSFIDKVRRKSNSENVSPSEAQSEDQGNSRPVEQSVPSLDGTAFSI